MKRMSGVVDGGRRGLLALYLLWRGQLTSARRLQLVFALVLIGAIGASVVMPRGADHSRYQAATPRSQGLLPSPSPSQNPPAVDDAGVQADQGVGYWAGQSPSCAPPQPAPLKASYFPRIVIPRVGINLEVHDGSGGTPPDRVWVAWFYPGLSKPGQQGNTYIYAHAHGNPSGSASGLFWPLHYMHHCDAIYVYTSSTTALRYVTASVNLHHSGRDTSPLLQTSDERVTLQTCNDWSPAGPKTIVVALRVTDPPPPGPPPSTPRAPSGGGNPGGSPGGGGGPSPAPTPLPLPIPLPSPPAR